MSWADNAIATLAEGNNATIKPRGNSMLPLIKSGATVELEPCTSTEVEIEEIVLCKVKSRVYLHMVRGKREDGRVLIGNRRGKLNGWTSTVYGRAIKVHNP